MLENIDLVDEVLGTTKKKRGLLFILSASSGTGKTTLSKKLLTDLSTLLHHATTYTTRKKRTGEVEGKDYYFIGENEFKEKIQNNDLYEYIEIFGAYYGTDKKNVEELLNNGDNVLLVIDVEGSKQIRAQTDCITIFLLPPSKEELLRRLESRNADTKEKTEMRLKRAQKEWKEAVHYDYIVINDDLEVATEAVKSIIIAEEHAVRNR